MHRIFVICISWGESFPQNGCESTGNLLDRALLAVNAEECLRKELLSISINLKNQREVVFDQSFHDSYDTLRSIFEAVKDDFDLHTW